MKCICCKFDNSVKEFEKHQSNTSFSALDQQFTAIANMLKSPWPEFFVPWQGFTAIAGMLNARGEVDQKRVCEDHRS
jgi:hypothetical protein